MVSVSKWWLLSLTKVRFIFDLCHRFKPNRIAALLRLGIVTNNTLIFAEGEPIRAGFHAFRAWRSLTFCIWNRVQRK